MAEKTYFGNDMTGAIQTEGGTSITISKFKDVEINAEVEHTELTSADTILRENVKRSVAAVTGTIGIASWDVNLMQQWLGGSGSSSTSFVDSTDPQLFQMTGEITPSDGSTNLKAVVTGCFVDEMPIFSATEEEWVQNDVEFRGKDITLTGP